MATSLEVAICFARSRFVSAILSVCFGKLAFWLEAGANLLQASDAVWNWRVGAEGAFYDAGFDWVGDVEVCHGAAFAAHWLSVLP